MYSSNAILTKIANHDVFLEEIPFETYSAGSNGLLDKTLPLFKGSSQFVNILDRVLVVVNINGFRIPFYLSSGIGGKKDVPTGKWYPFFGVSEDAYLNKGSSKDIVKYYESDELKQIAFALDNKYGDIRKNKYPVISVKIGPQRNFINKDMGVLADDSESKDAYKRIYSNVDKVKNFLNSVNKNFDKIEEILKTNGIYNDSKKGIVIFIPKVNDMKAYKTLVSFFGKNRLELSNELTNGKRLFYIKPTVDELKSLTEKYVKFNLNENNK
ncbi:MAG TPA: hypothetical protein PKJ33_02085 [Alphaproteobacteria bacterium]|nr:hypothetical protein [Alphaproteobacteria bacterium]